MEIKTIILIIIGILVCIFLLPYYAFFIGSIIIRLPIPMMEGACSDMNEPKGAIEFAYEHMTIKNNVTFIKIEPNQWEDNCERHYWATDTEGNTYRLIWSKMHREIQLNKSYTIKYMSGGFNALWEYE
jgi:hypothetical protein